MQSDAAMIPVEGQDPIPGIIDVDSDVVRVKSVSVRFAPYEGARAIVTDVDIEALLPYRADDRLYRVDMLVEIDSEGPTARATDGTDEDTLDIFTDPWDVRFATAGKGPLKHLALRLKVEVVEPK